MSVIFLKLGDFRFVLLIFQRKLRLYGVKMAKKKKKIQETTIENYYDLKIDKVDELVAALKDETGEFDEEISINIADCTGDNDPKNFKRSGKQKQFNPYKTDFLRRVPTWLKAVFVKWWFAGLVCFLIVMGLGSYLTELDVVFLTGLVLGVVVDLLVNPLLQFMESDEKEYNDYMMFPFPFKAYWTFFTNIIYYLFVTLCVWGLYGSINYLVNISRGTTDLSYLALEPLLFVVFSVIVDMVFIGIKDGIVRLVKKGKKKKSEAEPNV